MQAQTVQTASPSFYLAQALRQKIAETAQPGTSHSEHGYHAVVACDTHGNQLAGGALIEHANTGIVRVEATDDGAYLTLFITTHKVVWNAKSGLPKLVTDMPYHGYMGEWDKAEGPFEDAAREAALTVMLMTQAAAELAN